MRTVNNRERAERYVHDVYKKVQIRNPYEREFLQAVKELLQTVIPVLRKHPEFIEKGILERLTEPDRLISFRVSWVDDQGESRSTVDTGSSLMIVSDRIRVAFVFTRV